jgi:hypothetical protein
MNMTITQRQSVLPSCKSGRINELARASLTTTFDAALLQKAVVVPLQEVGFNLPEEIEEDPDDNQETGCPEELSGLVRDARAEKNPVRQGWRSGSGTPPPRGSVASS